MTQPKCKQNEVLNSKTNRCVKKSGKIGKQILLLNALKTNVDNTSEQTVTDIIEDDTSKFIRKVLNKLLTTSNKVKLEPLQKLARALHIDPTGRKNDLQNRLLKKLRHSKIMDIINGIRESKLPFAIEVKDILENNLDPTSIFKLNICATLRYLVESNPSIGEMFGKTCDLYVKNGKVVSNCKTRQVQDLYILCVNYNNEEYIVKLGSFAETQGMSKRIGSFGGGCYETGSRTNQWFQKFIRKAIDSGLKCRFHYFEKTQDPITLIGLKGKIIRVIPYIIRPLETELFDIYLQHNNNIPPIFGSNCTNLVNCGYDDQQCE